MKIKKMNHECGMMNNYLDPVFYSAFITTLRGPTQVSGGVHHSS
jgi:hypothetical protein